MSTSAISPRNRRSLGQRRVTAALLCTVLAGAVSRPAQARSHDQGQIWPGQRVLLVLPVAVSDNWNGDAHTGLQIATIAQPIWSAAIDATGKFSPTAPFAYDPLLIRAVSDKLIQPSDLSPLISTPSLATAQPVFNKLDFDQPSMIAEIKLEEIRVGGTAKEPSLELQVSGRLYQQGSDAPVDSIVSTSDPETGHSPEERVHKALSQVLNEIAGDFVTPKNSDWDSLLPMVTAAPAPVAVPVSAPAPAPVAPPAPAPVEAPAPAPVPAPAAPTTMAPATGGSFVPQLPDARPPLGITVPNDPTATQ